MRKKPTTATAAPAVDPEIIRHYHAHVYYDPISSRDHAARARGGGLPGRDPWTLARRAGRAAPAIDVSNRFPDHVVAGVVPAVVSSTTRMPCGSVIRALGQRATAAR
jgi:hypothetical protein